MRLFADQLCLIECLAGWKIDTLGLSARDLMEKAGRIYSTEAWSPEGWEAWMYLFLFAPMKSGRVASDVMYRFIMCLFIWITSAMMLPL